TWGWLGSRGFTVLLFTSCLFVAPATTEIYLLSLHDALPIFDGSAALGSFCDLLGPTGGGATDGRGVHQVEHRAWLIALHGAAECSVHRDCIDRLSGLPPPV